MPEGFPIAVQITKGDRTLASDAPALAIIPISDAPTEEARRSNRWFFSGVLAVSLLLHTLVALALIGGVARQFAQPQVDPIDVELVAPPELKTPEQKTPEFKIPELEQPKPKAPEPEEKKPEEKKPPEQNPEEQKPEEKKQEAPKAEQPPPPPPPPSEQKPEDKPAEPDKPTEPEKKAEADKKAEEKPAPIVLKPVVEFGDTESGPRKAEDGSAAQEANTSEQPEETPEESAQAGEDAGEPKDAQAAEVDPAETPPAETADTQEKPQEEKTQPEQTQAEQTEPASSEAPAPQILSSDTADDAAPDDFGTVGRIVTSATPAPKPAQRPSARTASNSSATSARQNGNSGRKSPRLVEARRLLSTAAVGGSRARAAMAGMPPGQRLTRLCMTELDAQLSDWDPTRPPEILPRFRHASGNVLQSDDVAYGSRGVWYGLAFRCEADKGVTRVVKFSFRVGPPVPPAKRLQLGLPPF